MQDLFGKALKKGQNKNQVLAHLAGELGDHAAHDNKRVERAAISSARGEATATHGSAFGNFIKGDFKALGRRKKLISDKAEIAKDKFAEKKKKIYSNVFDKISGLKESEYSDLELLEILDENNYEASIENLLLLREQLESGNAIIEELLDGDDPVTNNAEKTFGLETKDADVELEKEDDKKDDSDELEKEDDKKDDSDELEEADDEKDDDKLSESMNNLFSLINRINESVSQNANGPELKNSGEMDNEATLEKAPKEMSGDLDNNDVYGDDEDFAEDVGEVIVTEGLVSFIRGLINNTTSIAGVSSSREIIASAARDMGAYSEEFVNACYNDPTCKNASAEIIKYAKDLAEDGELAKDKDASKNTRAALNNAINELKEAVKAVKSNFQDKADEVKYGAYKLKNVDKKEKEIKVGEHGLDGSNIPLVNKFIKESEQLANGPELEKAGELDNEATLEKAPKEMSGDLNNNDVYGDDEDFAEDVDGVVVKESTNNREFHFYTDSEGNRKLKVNTLSESSENEATEERDPKESTLSKDTEDIYPADEHKQVEDVVEVVVEAAAICKANNKPATKANITEAAIAILEEKCLDLGAFASKKFDIDTAINSKEMTGTEATEKFSLKETVSYKSLKEACLLDEGYFDNDTYTVQTSDEKKQKLHEQISLLLARENMDPLYEELLKESIHAQRLQEALVKKYSLQAAERARNIYGN